MIRIEHTREEIDFLVNSVQPGISFEAELTDRSLFPDDDYEVSAFSLRMKLVAMQRMAANRPLGTALATYPVDWSPAELWALDLALWRFDYGVMLMGSRGQSGTPMFTLVSKIWDGLMEYHKEVLPEGLRIPQRIARREPSYQSDEALTQRAPAPVTEEQRARLREWDEQLGRTFE